MINVRRFLSVRTPLVLIEFKETFKKFFADSREPGGREREGRKPGERKKLFKSLLKFNPPQFSFRTLRKPCLKVSLVLFFLLASSAHAQNPFTDAIDEELREAQENSSSMLPSASVLKGTVLALQPEEQNFYVLINRFRAKLHLQPLRIDPRLETAATKHNRWMVSSGNFTHAGPDKEGTVGTRTADEGIAPTNLTEEIIATGSFSGKNVFLQWFFSPDHLGSMTDDDLNYLGISRTGCDESNPREEVNCYWTVDFAELDDLPVNSSQDQRQGQQQQQPWAKTSDLTETQVLAAGEAVAGPLDERKDDFSMQESTTDRVEEGLKQAIDWITPLK